MIKLNVLALLEKEYHPTTKLVNLVRFRCAIFAQTLPQIFVFNVQILSSYPIMHHNAVAPWEHIKMGIHVLNAQLNIAINVIN